MNFLNGPIYLLNGRVFPHFSAPDCEFRFCLLFFRKQLARTFVFVDNRRFFLCANFYLFYFWRLQQIHPVLWFHRFALRCKVMHSPLHPCLSLWNHINSTLYNSAPNRIVKWKQILWSLAVVSSSDAMPSTLIVKKMESIGRICVVHVVKLVQVSPSTSFLLVDEALKGIRQFTLPDSSPSFCFLVLLFHSIKVMSLYCCGCST